MVLKEVDGVWVDTNRPVYYHRPELAGRHERPAVPAVRAGDMTVPADCRSLPRRSLRLAGPSTLPGPDTP